MKIIIRLQKLNRNIFLLVFLLSLYAVSLPFFLLSNIDSQSDIKETSFKIFFIAVFLGPIVETFFFQHLIFEIYKLLKVKSNVVIACTSSMIFAYFHPFNGVLEYCSYFFMGLVLMSCYLVSIKRKEKSPFINTYIIHSLKNLVAVIISFFMI